MKDGKIQADVWPRNRVPKEETISGFFIQIRIYKILIQYKCNRGLSQRLGVARFSNAKGALPESAKPQRPNILQRLSANELIQPLFLAEVMFEMHVDQMIPFNGA
ncbi:UNVERIFIED_CONTAM: hypothetical protein ABID98_002634 [Brevibacillus sp. OAP136]